MTTHPHDPPQGPQPGRPELTLAVARHELDRDHPPASDPSSDDPLRRELAGLRSAEHVEAKRIENALAERMFGVANDPPRIDRFIIIGRLGAGGMGVVYSAYDPHLDRKVALKLLRDSSRVRSVERERLLREAHALARITHPNVVTVHEVGQLDDQVFVVMEFVVGQTLDAWARTTPRTWREVLEVYRQAGRGLAAAHAAGLVHRDFKPQNAIIGDDGRVRVVDFGLARGEHASSSDDRKITGGNDDPEPSASGSSTSSSHSGGRFDASLTRPNVLVGTPAYMSPEQYKQHAVGPASDQFSFCVALYEALMGTRPFAGSTPAELATQILDGAVREPPRGTGVPAWLLAILRRGLSVEPHGRFASMDALLVALARDPARTRRRWLLGAAVAGLCGLSVAALVQRPEAAPPCQGGPEALQAVWGSAQRDALQQHFGQLPTPHAEPVGSRILETLDSYGQRWQDMHHDACLAHHRGEQSGVLLDKRMACLQRRRAALGSAVEVLGAADVEIFENAAFMVHDLPPVHMCGDLDVLEAELPVPEDPAVAREVAAARGGLALATTLATVGRLDEAHRKASEWVEQARTIDYPPLIAEALLVRGRIEMDHESRDASRPSMTLLEAFHAGIATRNDTVAAEAFVRHLYIEAIRPGGRAVQDEDYGLVHSLLARLPDPSYINGLFLNNAGSIAASRGDYEATRSYLRQALDVKQSAPEPNVIEVLETRFNLALMSKDGTAQIVGLELAVEGFERELGPSHVRTFIARTILARATRDPLLAEERFGSLCAEFERNYPDTIDRITSCLFDEASRAAELGDSQRAAETFERIPSMLDGSLTAPLLRLRGALAQGYGLYHRGQPEQAIVPLRAALDEVEGADIPRWLEPTVIDLHVALGVVLVDSGHPNEAQEELRPAIDELARVADHRVDRAVDRQLASARLASARARIAVASIPAATRGEHELAAHRVEDLLDAAETWYRSGGPGYAWRIDEIQSLKARWSAL